MANATVDKRRFVIEQPNGDQVSKAHALVKAQPHRLQVFKAFGDWAQSLRSKAPNSGLDGPSGGYLIPEGLTLGMDDAIREKSFFHKYAQYQPMAQKVMQYPSVNPSGASGRTPLIGGFTMQWFTEGTEPTNSNPTFDRATLTARELGGVGYASKQLMEDGGAPLGAYLFNLFSKAVAFYITYNCLQGDGVGKPLGILKAPGAVSSTRAGSNAIALADIEGMLTKLLPASYPYAWWMGSGAAIAKMSSLAGYNSNVVANPDGTLQTAGSMRGLPVWVTECLPTLGTAGDLILIDPRCYVLGEHLQIEIAYAPEEPDAFTTYQVAFRVWWRGDGQPLWDSSMTAANGETTVSPFIILAA